MRNVLKTCAVFAVIVTAAGVVGGYEYRPILSALGEQALDDNQSSYQDLKGNLASASALLKLALSTDETKKISAQLAQEFGELKELKAEYVAAKAGGGKEKMEDLKLAYADHCVAVRDAVRTFDDRDISFWLATEIYYKKRMAGSNMQRFRAEYNERLPMNNELRDLLGPFHQEQLLIQPMEQAAREAVRVRRTTGQKDDSLEKMESEEFRAQALKAIDLDSTPAE